jgi:transposase-like protein
LSVLSKPCFHDEAAAFAYLESVVWADGPVCPHCGAADRISAIKPNPAARVRFGLKKCGHCKKQFTVKVGTVFEHARMPLHKMLQAVYLMTSSKKGVSAHQLHRTLEVTYKTAWFLAHRIREAMRSGDLAPFGAGGGMVEADETYIGRKPGAKLARGYGHKSRVVALIDRDSGAARYFHADKVRGGEIADILRANLAREAELMTDEALHYRGVGREFAAHHTVLHAGFEYVRKGRPDIHTNTVEGAFSIFKRGMRGVYQHCAEKHLHRYLAEFEFRYTHRAAIGVNDRERSIRALGGIVGRRLLYADSSPA